MWQPVRMQTGGGSNKKLDESQSIITAKLKAILMTFMDKAITIGAKYASASGRDMLTSTDVLYALQYQAHEFIDNLNDDIEKEFDNYLYTNLNDDNEESDEDNEEYDDDNEESGDDDEDEEYFTRCEGSDDPIIQKMNEYHDNWSNWTPSSRMQLLVKQAIDEIPI